MSQEEVNAKAKQAVLKYDVKGAKAAAQQAVDEKLDLVQVINDGFTAGIQEVGELFEAKKLYLPHIMAAANAMNAGVDILTPEIEKSGANTGEGLGKFVICTIEGDIHSIGKDIVAIMLKVAGTMVNQKTLEELLKEEGIRGDLITNVGGAPTTQQWADEIGADVYSENALDCVAKFKAKVAQ